MPSGESAAAMAPWQKAEMPTAILRVRSRILASTLFVLRHEKGQMPLPENVAERIFNLPYYF
jgi:hypothetical protein